LLSFSIVVLLMVAVQNVFVNKGTCQRHLPRPSVAQLVAAMRSTCLEHTAPPGGTRLAFAADAFARPFARERRFADKTEPGFGFRLLIWGRFFVVD
jgi:hypothetical protein